MIRRPRFALAALLAATIVAVPATAIVAVTSAAADETLLSVDGAPLVVPVPAPGHSADWALTATNVSSHEVSVSAVVASASGGALAGSHPLEITVYAPDGRRLALPSRGVSAASTPLGTIDPGATIEFRGHTALPRAAGDEYQGLGGELNIRLVGEDLGASTTSPGAGMLAQTGLAIAGFWIWAPALLGAGLLLLLIRRRRRKAGDPATVPLPSTADDLQVKP